MIDLPMKAREWVELITGQSILDCTPLAGSTSAAVFHIISTDKTEYVLRLFTWKSWLENEPDLARHEAFALKTALAGYSLTPSLIGFDETGEFAGDPAVLMTMLPGQVILEPPDFDLWVGQLAKTIFEIHQTKARDFCWRYTHWYRPNDLKIPGWTQVPEAFEQLIKLLKKPAPKMPTVFLHRDYHPTNVLWKNDQVSGVVDWVNACMGPALVDVSHCRLNLVSLYGVEIADKFLHAWLDLVGEEHYSLWWDVNGLADGWVFNEPISVYGGWIDFGKTDLTVEIIASRLDDYALSLAAKL